MHLLPSPSSSLTRVRLLLPLVNSQPKVRRMQLNQHHIISVLHERNQCASSSYVNKEKKKSLQGPTTSCLACCLSIISHAYFICFDSVYHHDHQSAFYGISYSCPQHYFLLIFNSTSCHLNLFISFIICLLY